MKELNKYLIEKLHLKSNYELNKKYTFNGFKISSGPVYYDGSKFQISDSWKGTSYGKIFGLKKGSYFFTWDDCHDINIDSYRLPTKDELTSIIYGWHRDGATVNGINNCKYSLIQLDNIEYIDVSEYDMTQFKNVNIKTLNGLLLFPDKKTIEGKKLVGINNNKQTKGMTEDELNEYLKQNCIFIPAMGTCIDDNDDSWIRSRIGGYYWTSTEEIHDSAYELMIMDKLFSFEHTNKKHFAPCFLISNKNNI